VWSQYDQVGQLGQLGQAWRLAELVKSAETAETAEYATLCKLALSPSCCGVLDHSELPRADGCMVSGRVRRMVRAYSIIARGQFQVDFWNSWAVGRMGPQIDAEGRKSGGAEGNGNTDNR
jgi:hypothetical protein